MPSTEPARSPSQLLLAPRPGRRLLPSESLHIAAARDQIDPLIRSLALDRLRDLRDDGVTTEYIGRIYGVPGEVVRTAERALRDASRSR